MLADLLVCPGCRVIADGRVELHTLARDGEALTCTCGRRYPIRDGVPIVLAGEPDEIEVREDADTAEHVSIYMDAHWAGPPGELVERIEARAVERVARAVELGCSAGRVVAALASGADHVVGVDLQFATLRLARRLLDGEPVEYGRRMIGRRYEPARAVAPAVPNRTLVCGDALDPPLVPRSYQRVVALNLVDSVPYPRQLLAVLDGLCAPGGEVIVASPFAWQDGTTEEAERITEADLLLPGYRVEDQAELDWVLRRDARSRIAYRVHYWRARKAG